MHKDTHYIYIFFLRVRARVCVRLKIILMRSVCLCRIA